MKTMFKFFHVIFFLCAIMAAGCDNSGSGSGNGTVSVSGVELNEADKSIKVDETFTLSATVEPANAANDNVAWSSSDEDVATVAGGVVTGLTDGAADITVTTEDGGKTDLCTVTVTKRDVYVAGRLADTAETDVVAGYWKNGDWNSYGAALYYVNDIAVDGGTVYLCGSFNDDGHSLPAYATGETPVELSRLSDAGDGGVNKILVRDGTVYCCGSTSQGSINVAALWINGTRTDFTASNVNSEASAIAVNGSAIYVAGSYEREDNYQSYGYWYRADAESEWVWTELDRESDDEDWRTYGGIALNGTDVYVGGSSNTSQALACYWLNGVYTDIHDESLAETNPLFITLYRGVLYLGGTGYASSSSSKAAFWTESSGWQLMPVDGIESFTVNYTQFGGMALSGNDIYLAGSVRDSGGLDHPYLWTNEVPQELPAGEYDMGSACGMCLD